MKGLSMDETIQTKTLRDFGLLLAGAMMVYCVWPWLWRGESARLWAGGIGGLLGGIGLVAPALLKHPYKGWMAIGHVLGWINTRIILGVIFFGLITPMGVIMRLFGWDSMRRAFLKDAQSYRVIREPRSRAHMTRQF